MEVFRKPNRAAPAAFGGGALDCTRCQHPILRTEPSSEMTAYAEMMLFPLGPIRALARKANNEYVALIECPNCGRENDVPIRF